MNSGLDPMDNKPENVRANSESLMAGVRTEAPVRSNLPKPV